MDSPPLSSSRPPASYSTPDVNSLAQRRQQKKMSITQTYYLAHTARRKLTKEASRADHNLRTLVGHANLLDSLMLDLSDAEQEQERWFNQTVTGASKPQSQDQRRVQWAETVVEEPEEEWDPEDASDADSDTSDDLEDSDEEGFAVTAPVPIRRRAPSPGAQISEEEVDDEDSDSDFEYDHGDDLEELTLTRSVARQSPPELLSDSDEESEDDTMPPSPPQQTFDSFDEKEAKATETELPLSDAEQPGLLREYYSSHRPQGALIPSY